MIARPTRRQRPIPFAAPDPAGCPASGAALRQPAPIGWVAPSSATAWRATQAANQPSHQVARAPAPALMAGEARASYQAATPAKPKAAARNSHAASAVVTARYVGQGSLSVRSSLTGRHYRFQGHGDCQNIEKDDLILLRRIADLQVG